MIRLCSWLGVSLIHITLLLIAKYLCHGFARANIAAVFGLYKQCSSSQTHSIETMHCTVTTSWIYDLQQIKWQTENLSQLSIWCIYLCSRTVYFQHMDRTISEGNDTLVSDARQGMKICYGFDFDFFFVVWV